MATKKEIMLGCLRQLSLVYGSSVNKYAEDKIYANIDIALQTVFKDLFWDRHIKKLKLHFENGVPTMLNINYLIDEFEDILTVLTDSNDPTEIVRGDTSVLPEKHSGSDPMCWIRAEDPSKVIQLVPGDNVDAWVVFRTLCKYDAYKKIVNGEDFIYERDLPNKILPDDVVPFDSIALQFLTCANYMVMQDDNKQATQNFFNQYRARVAKLKSEQNNSTMSYNNAENTYIPGEWYGN